MPCLIRLRSSEGIAHASVATATSGDKEIFVMGGGEIYALALASADRMYLTFVDAATHADTFFPEFNQRIGSSYRRSLTPPTIGTHTPLFSGFTTENGRRCGKEL